MLWQVDSKSHDSGYKRHAFSLLEIIIATGILAAATMMLLSLFSTGERHGRKAEGRVIAQMLCQTKLDELLVDPTQLQSADEEPIPGFVEWTFSVDWEETGIDGLVRVSVTVQRVEDAEQLVKRVDTTTRQPTFKLVRWMRHRTIFQDGLARMSNTVESALVTP